MSVAKMLSDVHRVSTQVRLIIHCREGKWRWTLVDGHGSWIAGSHRVYASKKNCTDAARKLGRQIEKAKVEIMKSPWGEEGGK